MMGDEAERQQTDNIEHLLEQLKKNRESLDKIAQQTKQATVNMSRSSQQLAQANMAASAGHWPSNVGIITMEIYFPSLCVSQAELEVHDGVSSGKYTIGLGQQEMGFCGDREDINSLCLTAVHNLLEKNNLDPRSIGRLEVGTETILDKSKSVKTVLMQLFKDSGNTDIEGIDTTNACYGGTSALFNAWNWIESSSWDGRWAVVVAADIAVYAEGNARCTGGAGAVAFLIGPNAPLVFDRRVKSTHMQHVYDFYKPDMSSEYPVVDGPLSIKSYLSALDTCYKQYTVKLAKKLNREKPCTVNDVDYFVFHSPYCKLVRKSFARCMFNDYITARDASKSRGDGDILSKEYDAFAIFKDISLQESLDVTAFLREVEKVSVTASTDLFEAKTKPSLMVSSRVGNMYTPSLYGCLISLLVNVKREDLIGRRIALFSYGSGCAASMFSVTVSSHEQSTPAFDRLLKSINDVETRLNSRRVVTPQEHQDTLRLREKVCLAKDYTPVGSVEDLFPGTYYLTNIDEKFRRTYARKPLAAMDEKASVNGAENGIVFG